MFTPKNILYGWFLKTNPPKNKYIISLYQSTKFSILACFTTSQPRAGVSLDQIKHGTIKKNGEILSYVFEPNVVIGKDPKGNDFCFPVQTTIRFDYCIKEGSDEYFMKNTQNLKVVGILDDEEYKQLIYAMYYSNNIPPIYKPIFENILFEIC